jgi:hypothetical protein
VVVTSLWTSLQRFEFESSSCLATGELP